MAEFSPMMTEYLKTKEEYKDCILFYRLGDFYEMFFDDAINVSRELELVLTGKACGQEEKAPMCGVPFHSADIYITRLVEKGYKVAICEQVEDPKQAKGLVKREVIRVVTPGTNLDAGALEDGKNNYILSIFSSGVNYGLAICDVSTGAFFVTEPGSSKKLADEIYKYEPSEILANKDFSCLEINIDDIKSRFNSSITYLDEELFQEKKTTFTLKDHFKTKDLALIGLDDFMLGARAAGAMLSYLYETQKTSMLHINTVSTYNDGNYMLLDSATRRNLELVETMREKEKRGSLLWVLDKTKTAMGARSLRSIIEQPLINVEEIKKRQKSLEELNNNLVSRDELREYLAPIYDLERLITRVVYETANPRDLICFKNSIEMLPHILMILGEFNSPLLQEIRTSIDPLKDLYELINESINEDPPLSIRDGGILKDGFLEEIDKLRAAKFEGKNWLAKLEEKEKEETGIKNLKVKYNKVFGYYIEVTNSNIDLVPDRYMRKQTLANAERFYTDELKELEETVLGAQDKLVTLEYEYFKEIRLKLASQVARIQSTAKSVAMLDVLCSLAYVAEKNNFIKPDISTDGVIDIKGGRHPVVELMINDALFIDNDTYLDNKERRISIITGPNMAGKSTYMRQSALIVLMAQIGSFVPATSAKIGVVDRIFTRVGASDDLASGQSTFMVEMNEVANILKNATDKSLLILDEIGRGTSTYDGLSIAWAVVEHISKNIGAKTLFATHYHELTELEGLLEGAQNFCIAVKENGDDIVFLRKIMPGGADRSYGIQVAKLAGLPDSVINRAKVIVQELSENDINEINPSKVKAENCEQISLFDFMSEDPIRSELKKIDISTLTPIEALNILNELQKL